MARARTEAAFGRGGGRFIAPGDQARLSSHRSTFTAWRRPIGQEKRPSGNYWTNSRSYLAKPKLSDYGVAAMSRRFPSTAQASNVQKREGVGWATDLKVPVRR